VTGSAVLAAGPRERAVVERLWQLYRHDLSELRGTMPDASGAYPTHRLDGYLDDPDRRAYLLGTRAAPAGFVLARLGDPHGLGEFFVVRAARRHNLAYDAALAVLALHPGCWEIAFQEENAGAARLRRRVAGSPRQRPAVRCSRNAAPFPASRTCRRTCGWPSPPDSSPAAYGRRMRVQLERSGGFAGRTRTWSVDVDTLDADGRAELQALVAEAGQWAAAPDRGADRFSYRLVTEDAAVGTGSVVRFAEPLSPQAQRLVSMVRSASA